MDFDEAATREEAATPNKRAFIDWLNSNGAIYPKIDYPVVFEGVGGVRANQEILPNEAFLFVPNKLVISVEGARRSEIAEVFADHEHMFCANLDRDFNTLLLFLVYERLKGSLSFWHFFF